MASRASLIQVRCHVTKSCRYNEITVTDTNAPHPTPQTEPMGPPFAEIEAEYGAPAHWVRWAVLILSAATLGAGWLAWDTQKRVQSLEQELVRRQQDSQGQATEARVLSKQAEDMSREAVARTTLLETRLAEVALQRTQVEDLIKTLSLSRDENLVSDIESSLRVASQQATLTSSAEPLIAALQSADERLAHAKQPRLDNIRRAVAKDLDRVRSTRVADLTALAIRLDEATRLVDELPLINQPEAVQMPPQANTKALAKPSTSPAPHKNTKNHTAPPAASASAPTSWGQSAWQWTQGTAQNMWSETQGLVRLTRIAHPEAMLISPDQGFMLRENIKLRLLNARLSLLSRQNDQALNDLQTIQNVVPRYFDGQSHKTQLLLSMLADVASQGRQTSLPRPDDTLAALATVAGGH